MGENSTLPSGPCPSPVLKIVAGPIASITPCSSPGALGSLANIPNIGSIGTIGSNPSPSPNGNPMLHSVVGNNAGVTLSLNLLNANNNNNASSPTSLANMQSTADYLAQLLKDRKQLAAFPNVFLHLERILDEEINKIRSSLFHIHGVEKKPLMLPEADGPVAQKQEKVYVPSKEHPEYNFVGRILGPRGMTAKQLEQETGCKIMVRGRGSMRDKKKEEQNRGKPNWEHLNDELHVLITVEDSPNRAMLKIQRAVEEIKKLLIPIVDGEDELKKRQLMELAIINGTYRDSSSKSMTCSPIEKMNAMEHYYLGLDGEPMKLIASPIAMPMRAQPTPIGAPLIISPRHLMQHHQALQHNGAGMPSLISPQDGHQLLYAPYPDFHHYAALTAPLLAEYANTGTSSADSQNSGTAGKQRRPTTNVRDHPYQRPAT